MSTTGERLREERERLGLSQSAFGELGGVLKRAQINYEKGERQPDAAYLSAIADAGADVLYILTGANRQTSAGLPDAAGSSNARAPAHLPAGEPTPIDADRLARIVEMLEAAAKQAGRRWPVKKLIAVAAEVYNALGQDSALEEPQVERILKLVVNR